MPHAMRRANGEPRISAASLKEASEARLISSAHNIKKLAKKLDMMEWQFRKYNDIGKKHFFKKGEIVYLQPKRNRGNENWHTVRKGETLWSISQKYGIKLKSLRKKNNLEKGTHLRTGMKLSLRWKLKEDGSLPWHAELFEGN